MTVYMSCMHGNEKSLNGLQKNNYDSKEDKNNNNNNNKLLFFGNNNSKAKLQCPNDESIEF